MKLIKDLGYMYATDTSKRKERFAIFECSICEKHFRVNYYSALSRNQKACKFCATSLVGKIKVHGLCNTPIYNTWRGMLSRCYNPKATGFKNYGDKGVTVCSEWRNNFESFKDWALANGWKEGLQIDKDKLCYEQGIFPKVYSPTTCLWVTPEDNLKYQSLYNEKFYKDGLIFV